MKHAFDNSRRTAVVHDPHPLCQSALSDLLGRLEIEVVGAATSVSTASTLLQEHRPDLYVTEIVDRDDGQTALRAIAESRAADPRLTVVVLSSTDERDLVEAAFDHGASAYVLKTSDPDTIATAIRQAFEPSLYLALPHERQTTRPRPAQEQILGRLTRRELEILQLVSGNRSNRQVAEILFVTDQTVKFHLANIYRKLGVGSRFEAARWARENGILDVAEPEESIAISANHELVRLWYTAGEPGEPTERLGETSL